ncbi:phosphatidylinositide phosphatase SAC2-like [Mercenaria mercenaria]|uniref:phosphatidylinositide phosphatase SAC2-like n=1 Tax=Mercenaria mercenaria TaxID=6596 RepID=UPI00234F003B|nr:phosphatidylinositide phosphatase SAC2-like [Mercenaria mercenaria]
MEVFQTDNHYIILDGEYSLWCSRRHGTLEPKTGNDLCSAWNPVCIGLVYGVIGKIKIHPDSEWRLLLISKQTCVGRLGGEHDVYQINKITVLSLSDSEPAEVDLDLCKMHHFGIRQTDRITQNADGQGKSLQKTWNTIKSAAENVKPRKKDVKDREKFERRILEELIKMYNESNSFYYCKTHDLTNSIQSQASSSYNRTLELWQRCDTRFFWNLHMVKELTDLTEQNDNMQEYKEMSQGTRSKRRGLDETGACANYVETEQIIEFSHHRVSFVQVRGSIPVFWSQTGVKYRPPPKLDKEIMEERNQYSGAWILNKPTCHKEIQQTRP